MVGKNLDLVSRGRAAIGNAVTESSAGLQTMWLNVNKRGAIKISALVMRLFWIFFSENKVY
jgi:hypothetical protein